MKSVSGLASYLTASTALVGIGDADGNELGGPAYARQPCSMGEMEGTREGVTILTNRTQIMFPPVDSAARVATAWQ